MFSKGFVCGWVAMATIVAFLCWGMTPHAPIAEGAHGYGYAVGRYYEDC